MPFVKGQSGNPGGRSAGLTHLRELAREKTEVALNTLIYVCEHGESDAARVAAANAILDRGYGKPAQAITGEDGEGPVEVKVTTDMDRAKALAAMLAKTMAKATPGDR
jgi:hypothetical protein